jgi:5-methyltetrahydropteroyltriglutamate--homocysteine methyltransferase
LAETHRTEVAFFADGNARREAQDDATELVVRQQEQVGLDLLTDGEQRRIGFINHVLASFDGVDLEQRHAKGIRGRQVADRMVPTIVGPVRRREQAVVEDFQFARSVTNSPLKMDVPGPQTIIDTTFDLAYGDEKALAMDLARAVNEEILALQAAGCDVVQIDEPAMTRLHDKARAYGAEALDRCLEGVTIPTIVHLCYGYPNPADPRQHQHEYPELLELLMQTRIGGFSLEFGRSQFPTSVLQICRDRLMMFGCIDPGPAPVEPVEQVAARVREALPYVDPANLLIAPDCGLMTINRDLARQKTELLVATAQAVRDSL